MTLREAAEQALEALEKPTYDGFGDWIIGLKNARDALRAALGKLDKTHSEDCYQWHHACAIAEILRLRRGEQ